MRVLAILKVIFKSKKNQEKENCSNWPGDGIFKKFLAEAVAAQEMADTPIGKNPQGSLLIANQNYRSGKP